MIEIGDIIECWGDKHHTYEVVSLNPPLWRGIGMTAPNPFYFAAIQDLVNRGTYRVIGSTIEEQEAFY